MAYNTRENVPYRTWADYVDAVCDLIVQRYGDINGLIIEDPERHDTTMSEIEFAGAAGSTLTVGVKKAQEEGNRGMLAEFFVDVSSGEIEFTDRSAAQALDAPSLRYIMEQLQHNSDSILDFDEPTYLGSSDWEIDDDDLPEELDADEYHDLVRDAIAQDDMASAVSELYAMRDEDYFVAGYPPFPFPNDPQSIQTYFDLDIAVRIRRSGSTAVNYDLADELESIFSDAVRAGKCFYSEDEKAFYLDDASFINDRDDLALYHSAGRYRYFELGDDGTAISCAFLDNGMVRMRKRGRVTRLAVSIYGTYNGARPASSDSAWNMLDSSLMDIGIDIPWYFDKAGWYSFRVVDAYTADFAAGDDVPSGHAVWLDDEDDFETWYSIIYAMYSDDDAYMLQTRYHGSGDRPDNGYPMMDARTRSGLSAGW